MNNKDTRADILAQLNTLFVSAQDAEKGYQEAADSVNDPQLKALFLAQAQERSAFAQALDREVRALGGLPDTGTSLAADLHRVWINFKSAVTGHSDKAVAEECKRGDAEALAEYREVLQHTDIAASTRELLLSQKSKVELAHDIMGRLALVV